MTTPRPASELVEHVFRHEYAKVVATLTRRFGFRHLELVEDSVQAALATALTAWAANGPPAAPGAWLFQVAHRNVLAALRTSAARASLAARAPAEPPHEPAGVVFEQELEDELLRMMFVACNERVPAESRLAFVLKTLCGFSTAEVAARLFTSEANVHKRLQRARERLQSMSPELDAPFESLEQRLPSVHGVLYVLFNEGHLSTNAERAIRAELCAEAIRLTTVLSRHSVGARPATFALLAVMHLHAARLGAREDPAGGLLLLEEQDRSRWDQRHLQRGAESLARAAQGEVVTRFHVEAAIAAEHCFAPSFAETNWRAIAASYAVLERIDPSPLHTLNRAVAVAEAEGPLAGLTLVQAVVPPGWLAGHFSWEAVLADLHRRAGHQEDAERHRLRALEAAPSDAIRVALARRWSR